MKNLRVCANNLSLAIVFFFCVCLGKRVARGREREDVVFPLRGGPLRAPGGRGLARVQPEQVVLGRRRVAAAERHLGRSQVSGVSTLNVEDDGHVVTATAQ